MTSRENDLTVYRLGLEASFQGNPTWRVVRNFAEKNTVWQNVRGLPTARPMRESDRRRVVQPIN